MSFFLLLFYFLPSSAQGPVFVTIFVVSAFGMSRASDGVGYWRAMTEIHGLLAAVLDPERRRGKTDSETLQEVVEALLMHATMKLPSARRWRRVVRKAKRS